MQFLVKVFRYDVIIQTFGASAGGRAAEKLSVAYHFVISAMYEGQSKNNEPKSLLALFIAIKSKVIHQKKAQG